MSCWPDRPDQIAARSRDRCWSNRSVHSACAVTSFPFKSSTNFPPPATISTRLAQTGGWQLVPCINTAKGYPFGFDFIMGVLDTLGVKANPGSSSRE